MKLYWQPPASALPVLGWRIERDDGWRRAMLLDRPLLTGSRWPAGEPAYVDQPEVGEAEVVYRLVGVDPPGRESAPSSVRVFVPDFTALTQPRGLTARSVKAPVELSREANASPHTRGYLVERAFQTNGPWDVLTPQGTGRQTRYADREALPGSTLSHRLRYQTEAGGVGEASVAVRSSLP